MTVAAAFLIAFLLLFGLLALPYSLLITGGSWLVGAGIFALIVARSRTQAAIIDTAITGTMEGAK
jgi:hypothetical protein